MTPPSAAASVAVRILTAEARWALLTRAVQGGGALLALACIVKAYSVETQGLFNVSTSTPVTAWAQETRLLADEVLRAWPEAERPRIEAVRRDMHAFVGRSTANQFVWNAVRGAPRGHLFRSLWPLWPLLRRSPRVWSRLLVALAQPHRWTRSLVLAAAARRGRQR